MEAVAEVALLLTLPAVVMFAKLASVMPAVPDKFELVKPVIEVTAVLTNAVVANCVVLVKAGAVVAVGVPVNEGESIVALNNISAVFVVILDVLELIFVFNEVILAVFALRLVFKVVIEFRLVVILEVLAVILLVSVVSALVALVVSAVTDATLEMIRLDKLAVSAFCNKYEVSVIFNFNAKAFLEANERGKFSAL